MDHSNQTSELISACIREHYPYLAAEYGVKRIGLFGSFATSKFIGLVEYLEEILDREVDVLTPTAL